MADISKVTLLDNQTYNIKDAVARGKFPFIVSHSLSASRWTSNVYSFETLYSKDNYDIMIELDGENITKEQMYIWNEAMIVGNSTNNTIKSMGEIPKIDIPIIIRVMPK